MAASGMLSQRHTSSFAVQRLMPRMHGPSICLRHGNMRMTALASIHNLLSIGCVLTGRA